MEIIFGIIASLSLIFCSAIVVIKTIFDRKIKSITVGQTGQQIQEQTNLKIQVLSVDGETYYGRVVSPFALFKCRLFFVNGKLRNKQKE